MSPAPIEVCLEVGKKRTFAVALDWPGFGDSEKPTPTDFTYSAASYAETLTGWISESE